MKRLAVVALVALLAACKPPVQIHSEDRDYRVVGVNPPKHFYVDLQDLKTGLVAKKVYVSKRCYNWREVEIGRVFNLKQATYQREDGSQYTRIEGARSICRRG